MSPHRIQVVKYDLSGGLEKVLFTEKTSSGGGVFIPIGGSPYNPSGTEPALTTFTTGALTPANTVLQSGSGSGGWQPARRSSRQRPATPPPDRSPDRSHRLGSRQRLGHRTLLRPGLPRPPNLSIACPAVQHVVLDLLLADGCGEMGRGLKRGAEYLLQVFQLVGRVTDPAPPTATGTPTGLSDVNLTSLPDSGWGEFLLTNAQPRSGSQWTDDGRHADRGEPADQHGGGQDGGQLQGPAGSSRI